MTNNIEAMKLALDAALDALETLDCGDSYKTHNAATALRQQISEAEQAEQEEPVAWGRLFDGDVIDCICPEEHSLNEGVYTIPLYTTPPQSEWKYDPETGEPLIDGWPLFSGLPHREWVDLTKEQCFELCVKFKDNPFSLLVAVSDILKEKNT